MKKNQFNGMTAAELNDKVVELKKELFNLRFQLATEGASSKVYEHKVARISKIKSRADEDEDKDATESAKRPVVDLEMCLGNVKRTVEVNLTDRSSFNYPLLIGAKALREFGAAVNPARRYTADKPDC